jgi:adenosylhomocysteine nucleosidase
VGRKTVMSLSALLQAWLRHTAQQTAREAAVEAMRRGATGKSQRGEAFVQPTDIPPADLPPCHVGVIFAMGIEAGPFEQRLTGKINIQGSKFTARQGSLKGRGIVVVHSDVGRENAARATETLIAGHKPKWIISAGLAGGLQPQAKRGDIVMADAILDDVGQRLAIDLNISPEQRAAMPGLHVGPLLTVDHIIFKADKKRELGKRHGAIAVDMETWGVAEVCRREKQRFLSVRVISDAVDEELPAEIERLVKKKGTARKIGAAAGSILRRPSTVKDLWRFRETALQCSERLAKFLEGVIEQLGTK